MSAENAGIGARVVLGFCIAAAMAPTATGIAAAAPPSAYDGVYVGWETLTDKASDKNYSECLRGPFKRRLVVTDGAVSYVYNPSYQGEVSGTINADGDVTAGASTSSGGVNLSGQIQGDRFTGEIWSLFCTYSLDLKRAP